jgi:protease-4
LYGSQLYVRGLLDKIHVTPDFMTCGAYKSAAETYMRSSPSPEAERMYDWMLDSLYETYVGLIAEGREVPRATVSDWVELGICSAEKAAEHKIIDAAETTEAFLNHIKQEHGEELKLDKRYGKSKGSTVDLSNPFAILKIWADLLKGASQAEKSKKDAVAIVYVEGAILPGRPIPSPFSMGGAAYSDPIRKALDKAANDEAIKAVVLRVDSPGGSAVASEIILQATRRLAAKKPFVVSMGDVAGSGGYYVACGADTIVADASTVTASIGVVGGKFATDDMWESIGITWHSMPRGKHADMLYSGQPFTDEQREILQSWMDEVYEVFKGHVVRIRGDRLTKPIDEIAGGRVFTGRQALELGLVDRLGTLSDAIRLAADKAGLKDYDVRVVPRPKSFVELLMADLAGDDSEEGQIRSAIAAVAGSRSESLWRSVAPLLSKLQPQQAQAVQRALLQLEVMQREQVSLAMPEFVVVP